MSSGRISSAVLGLTFVLSLAICKSQAGLLTVTHEVTFDITIDDFLVGQIKMGLFGQTVPKTVANFVALAAGTPGYGFQGTIFHRIIKGFVVQGGDIPNSDGTGFISIYGDTFSDENFKINNTAGFVDMANKGPDTNGCQYAILLEDAAWLNGKHVVFAKILDGMNVVHRMENLPTNGVDHPIPTPRVSSCKVITLAVPYDVTQN